MEYNRTKCFRRIKFGMSKLNVAIADDNERMLRLLGDIIRSDEELEVVGMAKDGEEAYKMIKEKRTGCRFIRYCHAKVRWTRSPRPDKT